MKALDLQNCNQEQIIEHIVNNNLNPDDYLKLAIELGRLDLVKKLMGYGATISSLCEYDKTEAFLETLPKDISEYLFQFFYKNNDNSELTCICDELFRAKYNISNSNSFRTRRDSNFKETDKIMHWSVGLTEREVLDESYLTDLNQTCGLYDWDQRFSSIDLEKNSGFIVLSTVSKESYDQEFDTEYISPNISGKFHIYLLPSYMLFQLLGELAFYNSHQILGFDQSEKEKLFKTNGQIDCEIYGRMKDVVSKYYEHREGR